MPPSVGHYALPTGLPPTSVLACAPSPGGRSPFSDCLQSPVGQRGANRFAGKPVKGSFASLVLMLLGLASSAYAADQNCEPAPPLGGICLVELEREFGLVGTVPKFELSYKGRSYKVEIKIEDQLEPGSSARVAHDLAASLLKKRTGETHDFDAVAYVESNMHKLPKQFATSFIRDGDTLSSKPRIFHGVDAYTVTREKRVWTDQRSGIRTAFAVDTTMITVSTERTGFDPDDQDRRVHESVLRAIRVAE